MHFLPVNLRAAPVRRAPTTAGPTCRGPAQGARGSAAAAAPSGVGANVMGSEALEVYLDHPPALGALVGPIRTTAPGLPSLRHGPPALLGRA